MRQQRSSQTTKYQVNHEKKPAPADGYPQRIEIWNTLATCGPATRNELHAALLRVGHERPYGAVMDLNYVRVELTDMCKRGFICRVHD